MWLADRGSLWTFLWEMSSGAICLSASASSGRDLPTKPVPGVDVAGVEEVVEGLSRREHLIPIEAVTEYWTVAGCTVKSSCVPGGGSGEGGRDL